MKIGALEEHYALELGHLYDGNEVEALFSLAAEHVLGLSPVKLRMAKQNSLAFIDLEKLLSILNDLIIGKPIQHILGTAHFYGAVFEVNEYTLIPRPETEELVDWVISDHRSAGSKLRVLDIGTGSGCIPISLKKYLPDFEIVSLDISSKALAVAKRNAVKINAEVNFIEADILTYESDLRFDIIISNPPYIRELEKKDMHNNVLVHEPHLALFVSDQDPLIFYQAIADFAQKHLNDRGVLYLEVNEFLGKEMIDMLKLKGFNKCDLRQDMQGKDRMIKTMISDEIA